MIQNTKRYTVKPPIPAPSHLAPSIEASNVISYFCTHPEKTYEYTSKYILPPSPFIQTVVFYALCTAPWDFHLTIGLKKSFYINT